jgi:hypothetical protein
MPRARYIEIAIRDRNTSTTSCPICSHEYCPNDECARSSTSLRCCEQSMCTICLAKMSKRCTCDEACDIVISYCAYCRCIGPVSALDIYLGLTKEMCASCKTVSLDDPKPSPTLLQEDEEEEAVVSAEAMAEV